MGYCGVVDGVWDSNAGAMLVSVWLIAWYFSIKYITVRSAYKYVGYCDVVVGCLGLLCR